MTIPFIDLKTQYIDLKLEINRRISTVLDHGQYIMGPEVFELENNLSTFTGSRHCITVASGTEALLISLMALEIGSGDEVITSPFTFASTGEVIVLTGAKPVFIDIDPHSYNMDPNLLEAAITPRTKAIMPVSLYGQAPDMDAINRIAAKHGNIPVIEDAAQSFGSSYNGRASCNLSTFGCTSFFPSKPLGCYGDGGAIFTNDDALALACREIRVHGQSERYVHTRIGVGGRMDTLQCAITLAKLGRFEWELEQRQAIASQYFELLTPFEGEIDANCIRLPQASNFTDRHVYGQFTIQVLDRDAFRSHLTSQGVPTAVHYPTPLNQQPAYAKLCGGGPTPVAIEVSRHVLSLPMGADLKIVDQRKIVTAIETVLKGS